MILAVSFAVIVSLLFIGYKRLYGAITRKDNRCDVAWEAIDEQLQRRSSLIPQFVKALEAHPSVDNAALAQLSATHNAYEEATTPEAKMAASAEMTSAISLLLTIITDNPELANDESLLQLREEFQDIITKLGYARASYNDCVLDYNNTISTLPGKLISGSRFRARQGFEAVGDTARISSH